ncbi:hypothetical protein [Sphingomonas kyungheensis]|uniref:Glycosyl transferase n=1 Tax=Sphingomonas kyungheensis TaxID=1069987 RepID=A0ABU8H4L6_9SPHN
MSSLIFTICARNYVGLAEVLGKSVAKHGANIDFRIYVADEIGSDMAANDAIISAPAALEPFIDAVEFANMAFMYNITEFCTALKAACFMHAFADGYDKCVYMDPDTFLTADVEHILRELDSSAILITPHLCVPSETEGPRADRGILATGVYNLGFLGLRSDPETTQFLVWWHARLQRQAFNDHYNALYTDQRWIDFVPALFSSGAVKVWRHLGCNVAPWNYHERKIVARDGTFCVTPRASATDDENAVPLVFLHFSGFDFKKIIDGEFSQLNLSDVEDHPDLRPVYAAYAEAISERANEMARYLSIPYGFERFADDTQILPSHRRLFRVWLERHGFAADPFGVGVGSFYAALVTRGLLGKSPGADLAMDKATTRSVANADRLLERAHTGLRLLFRMVGRSRFFFFVRSLNRLAHIEQHYDTFRLDQANIVSINAKSNVV